MRERLRVLGLVAALGPSCLPAVELTSPPAPDETATSVVVVEAGARVEAYVAAGRPDLAAWANRALPADARFSVFAYDDPPETLQLAPGLHVAPFGPRALPPATWTAAGRLEAGRVTWAEDAAPRAPPPVDRLGFEAFAWNACLSLGGCGPATNEPRERCETPCPAPAVTPPAAPEGPDGPGWVDLGLDSPVGATPRGPPIPARLSCPPDRPQAYGASACGEAPVCPAFPAPPEGAPNALFVRAGAASGDGSTARPFGDLAEAAAGAAPGDALLLAPGVYPLPAAAALAGRRVVGACASQVVLRAEAPVYDTAGVHLRWSGVTPPRLDVPDGTIELSDVRWRGVDAPLLTVRPAATASVSGARVFGGSGDAFRSDGGTLILSDAVVAERAGAAVGCGPFGRVEVRRAVFEAATETSSAAKGLVADGCVVRTRDLLVEGTGHLGVGLVDADADLADLAVRGLRSAVSGEASCGLAAREGTRVRLRRGLFTRNAFCGVTIAGSVATLSDLVFLDNGPLPFARDLAVDGGGEIDVTRLYAFETSALPIVIEEFAGRARLTDITLDARFDNLVIGALRISGGTTRVERAAIHTLDAAGISVRGRREPEITLEDVLLYRGEQGISLAGGARLAGKRIEVRRARQVGLQLGSPLNALTNVPTELEDVRVEQTQLGPGILVRLPTALTLEGFSLAENRSSGLEITFGGTAELSAGEIVDNGQAGVRIAADSETDTSALVRGVLYRGNDAGPIEDLRE